MALNDQSNAYTLLTKDTAVQGKSGTLQLYPGSINRWTLLRVTMLTAGGAVAVGFSEDISPPLSGKGRQLFLNTEVQLYVAPGQKVWYACDSVQRLAIQLEPLPWLQQIVLSIGTMLASMTGKPATTGSPETVTGGPLVPGWQKLLGIGAKKVPPKTK